MRPEDLRKRTKSFAIEVSVFCDRLPPQARFQEPARQLRRAAHSVASNYRAAGRARSHAEFTAKMGVVVEEADESQHWLEILADLGASDERLTWLRRESGELLAIFTASHKTASRRGKSSRKTEPETNAEH